MKKTFVWTNVKFTPQRSGTIWQKAHNVQMARHLVRNKLNKIYKQNELPYWANAKTGKDTFDMIASDKVECIIKPASLRLYNKDNFDYVAKVWAAMIRGINTIKPAVIEKYVDCESGLGHFRD